jgi:signal transduction histidine kinase
MSYDSLYRKMASSPERGGASDLHESVQRFDSARHISPVVAHELNNILTVVQGYSDCLLLQHHEDAELQPHLKMISEASRRATAIVREATRTNQNLQPSQQAAA